MKQVYTQKPRLCAALMKAGEEVTDTANIFNPQHRAWLFTPTPNALRICEEYFEKTGEQISKGIQRALDEYKNGGELDENI